MQRYNKLQSFKELFTEPVKNPRSCRYAEPRLKPYNQGPLTMVQYIFTPWRSRRELLAVRRQFYPDHQPQRQPSRRQLQGQTIWPTTRNTATTAYSSYHATANGPSSTPTTSTTTSRKTTDKTSNGEKQKAVARVSMWMQRGGCPHMVESTALLTAAILSDEVNGGTDVGIGVEDGAARASRGYAVRAAYSAAFSR